MALTIDPLSFDAPMVDALGRPTPLFLQRWNALRAALSDLDTRLSTVEAWESRLTALEALGGVSGIYDTETHYLILTIENGRVTEVTETPVPP